jgi:hypothetical protein
LIKDQIIPDPYWLAGFVDGECFYFFFCLGSEAAQARLRSRAPFFLLLIKKSRVRKKKVNTQNSSTHRLGCKVELRFKITQHYQDVLLMESLVKYLDCGKVFSSFFYI